MIWTCEGACLWKCRLCTGQGQGVFVRLSFLDEGVRMTEEWGSATHVHRRSFVLCEHECLERGDPWCRSDVVPFAQTTVMLSPCFQVA